MSALPGLDTLFSRKGEAVPVVQAAIHGKGRSRFEDLARALGGGGDDCCDDDNEDNEDNDVIDGLSGPATGVPGEGPPLCAEVTPFPIARTRAGREAGASAGSPPCVHESHEAEGEDADADDEPDVAARVDGSFVRRTPTGDGKGRGRPWQRLRNHTRAEAWTAEETVGRETPSRPPWAHVESDRKQTLRGQIAPPWMSMRAHGSAQRSSTRAPVEDPADLEVYLFAAQASESGADSASFMASSMAMTADASSGPPSGTPVARRHVSVRLPPREHALLRQFARVCETTQQNIVRRALLTYMIEELRRRLDVANPGGPSPEFSTGAERDQ